ncbi:MAG: DUF1559 domain-containing protein [Blastochloris sp.]|nr:DUF1559 domain-containing protein [Blastochloris sp.]
MELFPPRIPSPFKLCLSRPPGACFFYPWVPPLFGRHAAGTPTSPPLKTRVDPCLPRHHCGFTLIELVVAVVIVGILVSLLSVAVGSLHRSALLTKCMSNQRQIGLALQLFANENDGIFPPTTHSTGSFNRNQSWIFELAPYLRDVDEIRVCPADPTKRQQRILKTNSTSYVLNDLVFDTPPYNHLLMIPKPSETILLFILSENRAPSITRDHIHGDEWNSWAAALNDIEPDRHRAGQRAPDRSKGSANYLFADGHVENIAAATLKSRFAAGINPSAVPEH